MLGLDQIKAISRKAAIKAARENLVPFAVEQEDTENMPPFPFPFLGDHTPRGWCKVEEFFVDSSGFGTESEAALTVRQFLTKIKIGRGYAITEAGEFQVYVGEYKQVK